MKQLNQSIEVEVPIRTAYNQWTQFESFPEFMSGVERVEQVSDTKTHWITKIMGVSREFDAEITEQHPDEWIAWKTEGGLEHSGEVIFKPSGDSATLVAVQIEYEPQDYVEQAGVELGLVHQRLKSDLKHFKEFMESKGEEDDGWRGEIGEPLPDESAEPNEVAAPNESGAKSETDNDTAAADEAG
jgi:uncharacterized membrane protein